MTVRADWEEARRCIAEHSACVTSLHEARVSSELRDLIDAHSHSTRLRLLCVEGEIPYGVDAVEVLLDTPHLAYDFEPWLPDLEILRRVVGGEARPESVVQRRLLPIRIELPPTHPDRANPPRLILRDHRVFHAAALGPNLCWAEGWNPTMFLTEVLREVAALLRFERPVELLRPLNPQAAKWLADGHPGFDLPLANGG